MVRIAAVTVLFLTVSEYSFYLIYSRLSFGDIEKNSG